jgi:hypothetical protein
VLILVVALLALLALIGIAYLGTSQVERYASQQNSIDTQADLLIGGLTNLAATAIPVSLYGTDAQGRRLRPPSQEMPLPVGASATGYSTAVSPATMLLLADRLPVISRSNNQISWGRISWPLNPNSLGQYAFESPFGETTQLYSAANKSLLEFQPVYRTIAGQVFPAMLIFLPPANVARFQPPLKASSAGYYLTPGGPVDAAGVGSLNASLYNRLATFAGSASGDGIADSGLWQLPCGPINGITYYAALRVIDQNSAINASVAWRSDVDPASASTTSASTTVANYGWFRSNVGLQEMLAAASADKEMQALNAVRFGSAAASTTTTAPVSPTISSIPFDNGGNARTDFQFGSWGDAIDSQLARRVTAPGMNSATQPYHGFNLLDSSALASRFSLLHSAVSSSLLEQSLPAELLYYPNVRVSPYSATEVNTWYSNLFSYSATFSPSSAVSLRPLLTALNGVSNAIASRFGNSAAPKLWLLKSAYQFGDWVIGPDQHSYVCLMPNSGVSPLFPTINKIEYWTQVPWTTTPVKASANTATFEQLWLAYCHVMTDSQSPASSGVAGQWLPPMRPPTTAPSSPEPQMTMFRSSIRDNRALPVTPGSLARVQLSPMQMMQLRAAIAAVNTLQMRNAPGIASSPASRYVVSRHIVLADSAGHPVYDVEVFGTDAQPYINAMYAHVTTNTTSRFIAVQLVNPYPVAIRVTPAWSFATVDRTQFPSLTITSVGTVTPAFTIPAAVGNQPGMITIEDGTAPAGFAQPPKVQQIIGLAAAIGKEFIILRPRRFDGIVSQAVAGTPSGESYNETNVYDLVPVDQLDMTGTAAEPNGTNLYYRRAGDSTVATPGGGSYGWNFTWPGRYNGYCKQNPKGPTAPPTYLPAVAGTYPFAQPIVVGPAPQMTGTPNPNFSRLNAGAADSTARSPSAPTYSTITLRLNSKSMPGPHGIALTGNQFPFGGLARNADLLQVPYIGAYRITPFGQQASAGITEINSVTMDSSLADDQTLLSGGTNPDYSSKVLASTATDSLTDPFVQQIGRFCPIGDTQPGSASPVAAAQLDFGTDPVYWHYHWTKKLFDYLTVQAPHDDYFPNVDPSQANVSISPKLPARYLPADPGSPNFTKSSVIPIANSPGVPPNSTTGGRSEDTAGVEGLVNINTAGWKVLSMIPWVPRGTDNISDTASSSDGTDDNINLARAIVAYRDANGPFASIADLYNVPAFRLENDKLLTGADQNNALLNLSSDGVRFDFADRFLLLNRASNLITTRSETFTCYVLLQGWRHAGSNGAQLVVERRAAFFADRNSVSSASSVPLTFRIPTQ